MSSLKLAIPSQVIACRYTTLLLQQSLLGERSLFQSRYPYGSLERLPTYVATIGACALHCTNNSVELCYVVYMYSSVQLLFVMEVGYSLQGQSVHSIIHSISQFPWHHRRSHSIHTLFLIGYATKLHDSLSLARYCTFASISRGCWT